MPVVTSASGDSFDAVPAGGMVASAAAPVPCEGRSSGWAALAHKTVEASPRCGCCRATVDLQVHHVLPFHVRPDLELETSNLMVLCRRCHLLVGHLADWRSWNVLARSDAAKVRAKIDARPTTPTKG